MKVKTKIVFYLIIILGIGGVLLFVSFKNPSSKHSYLQEQDNILATRLNKKAEEALSYCKANNMNTEFCVLVDMKVHSGKYRLFVYDFTEKKVMRKSLCAHGCGKGDLQSTGDRPLFSNVSGSLLTSLGKYKIGTRAYSNYGIHVHYKLHGLETTNSNAFQRIIVLHSHSPISTSEVYPQHLPMGWSFGCPVVDDNTMRYLDEKLKNTMKPPLLWIYY